jgi:glycosyltransferase involved in cell wall biosynthesis
MQTNIRFLPWFSQEDLRKEYQDSDVLVFPSLYEGMSNVVLAGC